jgi:26S proteasome non-ATPase regulatory subunit 10
MIASSVGCAELVKTFLARGCDTNHANENKQRPLHYASSRNHAEIADLLLSNGAQVNASDKYLSTALHRAASKGYIKIVDLLLTKYGANVDQVDIEGNSPL